MAEPQGFCGSIRTVHTKHQKFPQSFKPSDITGSTQNKQGISWDWEIIRISGDLAIWDSSNRTTMIATLFYNMGTGKLKFRGGIAGSMKESIQRAFSYIESHKVTMGIGQEFDTSDFHVEAIDLLSNRIPADSGVAFITAVYSAIRSHPARAGVVILGDISIQGNIKPLSSLIEVLQNTMDNGGKSAIIPVENKRMFLEVSGDILEQVDPIFYGDPITAAMKALGLH